MSTVDSAKSGARDFGGVGAGRKTTPHGAAGGGAAAGGGGRMAMRWIAGGDGGPGTRRADGRVGAKRPIP